MHYLIVSPTPLFPAVAGNRSLILAMVRQIRAAGHRISFLYSIQEDITNKANRDMLREVDALYLTAYHHDIRHAETRRASKQPGPMNYALDSWYDEDAGELVKLIYERDPFDVIVNNYIWMSKIFESVPAHVIKIQQTHDSMSNRLTKLAKQGLPPSFFSVTPQDEGRGLDRADINISLQYAEELYFRTLTTSLVRTVQHATRAVPFSPLPAMNNRKLRVGFIGSDNSLNIKTVQTLILQLALMPIISSKIELYVAGLVCETVTDPPPFVTLMGPYDDIQRVYEVMDIMVNPMEDGTGLKIKSVEALQYHRPILMTMTGSEGLLSPYHFHRCKTVKEVLGYLLMIIKNPDLLSLMQSAGSHLLNAYQCRLAEASHALTAPKQVVEAHRTRTAHSKTVEYNGRIFNFYDPATTDSLRLRLPSRAWTDAVAQMAPEEGVWLDIGSRNGECAIIAAHITGASKVIAVEFDPEHIEQIKLNVIRNNMQDVVDMQLLGFAVGSAPGFGTISPPATAGDRSTAVFHNEVEPVPGATVPFATPDQFFKSEKRIDVIHLDVSSPFEMLDDLASIIRKFSPVILIHTKDKKHKSDIDHWANEEIYAAEPCGGEDESYILLMPDTSRLSRSVG